MGNNSNRGQGNQLLDVIHLPELIFLQQNLILYQSERRGARAVAQW